MNRFVKYLKCFLVLSAATYSTSLLSNDSYEREPTIEDREGYTITLKEYAMIKRRNPEREPLFRCKICGQVFDEKDLRGHSNYYGHYEFENYGYG